MVTVLFGDIATGRLTRLRYLGWSLLLGLIGVGLAVVVGFMIGITENMVGGELESAQAQIQEHLGIPAIIVMAVCGLVLLFCSLNLMAKRIRDMGLRGWWTVLSIMVLGAVLSTLLSEQLGSIFHLLVWLALLLVPTAALGRGPSN